MTSIFISHAHSDELLARRLATVLEKALALTAADFFLSSEEGRGVTPAADIREEILRKLSGVPALLILLTPKAAASPWVWLEAGHRLGKPASSNPLFLVPSARHLHLLQPVSDLRCLKLDNDGEVHEMVRAVGKTLERAPVDFLVYRAALEELMSAVDAAYSPSRERRARTFGYLRRNVVALAFAAVGIFVGVGAGRVMFPSPHDVGSRAISPGSESTIAWWTLKGAVKNAGFASHEVETSITPPDLRLKPDFTFEGRVAVETAPNGMSELPKVIFTLKNRQGFSPTVVHLVNPGQALPPGVLEDFDQSVDPESRVVDIRKPIEFRRASDDPAYVETEAQAPVAVAPKP